MERLKQLFTSNKRKSNEHSISLSTPNYSLEKIVDSEQKNFAQLGSTFFSTASTLYPADSIGIGAKIVLLCRKHSVNIDDVQNALLASPQQLEKLATKANIAHSKRGKGPVDDDQSLSIVTAEKAANIVQNNFELAKDLLVLTDQELNYVCNLSRIYKELVEQGMPHPEAFHLFRSEVLEMVKKRAQE